MIYELRLLTDQAFKYCFHGKNPLVQAGMLISVSNKG